jgi:uncharacterized membrane protein YedE/YeeE
MEKQKLTLNWTRIIITLVIIIMIIGVISVTVWYFMDQKTTDTVQSDTSVEDALRQAKEFKSNGVCATVMTPATHTASGAKNTFGSSCLPQGWTADR